MDIQIQRFNREYKTLKNILNKFVCFFKKEQLISSNGIFSPSVKKISLITLNSKICKNGAIKTINEDESNDIYNLVLKNNENKYGDLSKRLDRFCLYILKNIPFEIKCEEDNILSFYYTKNYNFSELINILNKLFKNVHNIVLSEIEMYPKNILFENDDVEKIKTEEKRFFEKLFSKNNIFKNLL